MDAGPSAGSETRQFVFLSNHLRRIGLSAPEILAEDVYAGFLLLEDLGDDLFARMLERDPGMEAELYAAAVDVLIHMQQCACPDHLPPHTADFMAAAAGLAVTWYAAAAGRSGPADALSKPIRDAISGIDDRAAVLVHRDYHAENLIWLPRRTGIARVGILDFQLGSCGSACYDLVSLLQDARRDVSPVAAQEGIARFARLTGRPVETVVTASAILGAQRALRILGVFARLCLRDAKPGYLRHLPRVWAQLQRNLDHPALEGVGAAVHAVLPPPDGTLLQRIRERCGQHPEPPTA